jgi:hypothetical protein
MTKHNGAAVDEGRDPYGKPGRGNADIVWRSLTDLPCPQCGATGKSLHIEDNAATLTCIGGHERTPAVQTTGFTIEGPDGATLYMSTLHEPTS